MPRVVIAGCGFVGLATARVFQTAGWDVLGLTHSAESAAALKGEAFSVAPCDISDAEAVRAIASGLAGNADAVIHCASSGRGGADAYRAVYLEGARNLLDAFVGARLIFTSSTSVYAQTDGAAVNEDSPAEPPRETGQILRGTEELVLARGGIVARRVLIEEGATGIFNVSDDAPMPQREIYAWLAERFARVLPPSGPIDPNRKRGWTSKRVSNAKLRVLGWAPQFPSFFDAVERQPELVKLACEN